MKPKFAPITEEEERELIESTERGEWVPVANFEEERAKWEAAARAYLERKRQRISISIPLSDLNRIKARAAEEGIPYQTLINSILHKYVEGR
jgi:predicted DNA binding CopG/RHH family protein